MKGTLEQLKKISTRNLVDVRGLNANVLVDISCIEDNIVNINTGSEIIRFMGKFEEEDMVFIVMEVA